MTTEPLHILLVDDDDFFAEVIARQLEEELHHKVTIANNGRQAEKLLIGGKNRFDIILTDYEMPDVDGIELLEWIAEQKINTPVVMLTAAGSETVAVKAMKLGAYDYVRKEHLDLYHLGVVINATRERYELRIARALEEERMREIALNAMATDKVRDVLNALTPLINDSFANIYSEIDIHGNEYLKVLPEKYRKNFEELFQRLKKETSSLETSVKGLLGLYSILYAHHAEVNEIERLRNEIQNKNSKPVN